MSSADTIKTFKISTGGVKVAKMGRPPKYVSEAEKRRTYRAERKAAGYRTIRAEVSAEDKALFDKFLKETGQNTSEAVPFLVYYYYEEERRKKQHKEE